MRGALPRASVIATNLTLLAAIGWLIAWVFFPPKPAPFGAVRPTQLAIESRNGASDDPARWRLVWDHLELAPPPKPAQVEQPAQPAQPSTLEATWDLLCVFVDPHDAGRCTAIVGTTGGAFQTSLGPGDRFEGGEVLDIEVEGAGPTRRGRMRVRFPSAPIQSLELQVHPSRTP